MSAIEPLPDPPPSPFLPGTRMQYAWDSTSLGYLKICPRLYYYHIIEGWQAKEESIHLRFGTEYHAALQAYDLERAAGISHDDAVFDVTREVLTRTADWDPDSNSRSTATKNRETLVRAVIWHLDYYRDDAISTVKLTDGRPAVELSFRFAIDEPYLLCGHLDRVVTWSDELYVMDYKTTTWALTDRYFNQWEPNNQMSLYALAGQVVLDATVKGVIIDAARIKEPTRDNPNITVEFKRGFTHRTGDQLDEWLDDLRAHIKEAEQYASEGYWPHRDTSCDKYGGCRFRNVCSKSPSVRQRFLEADFTQLAEEDRWNPLKPR